MHEHHQTGHHGFHRRPRDRRDDALFFVALVVVVLIAISATIAYMRGTPVAPSAHHAMAQVLLAASTIRGG